MLSRRLIAGLVLLPLALATPGARAQADDPPIVFVHGNGDTAALWIAQIWRFESNGYPRDRLLAVNLKYPSARSVDDKPQEGRSSTQDVMKELAAFVAEAKRRTGAQKVALEFIFRGACQLVPSSHASLQRVGALMERYSNVPMDFADATLVVLGEELETDQVFSLDRRGFSTYRSKRRKPFSVIP